jgi:hypothetical protein
MMWILVFLTQGLAINVAAYDSEMDCAEIAFYLNQHVVNAEYNCEEGSTTHE